jgi:hypothetical protein
MEITAWGVLLMLRHSEMGEEAGEIRIRPLMFQTGLVKYTKYRTE